MKYILAVLVMTFSMQSTADNWLCIRDKATGFSLKNGSWNSTDFKVGKKYIIKDASERNKSVSGSVYQVHEFGDDIPDWICGDFQNDGVAKGMLVCDGYFIAGNTFKYNPSTGHFLATHTAGFVYTWDDGRVVEDTPIIEIGKCSKL